MSGNKANRKPLVEALPPTTAPDRQQKISQRKQSVDGGKRKVAIELASSSETVLASSPSALKKKSIQAVPPVPLSTTETENSSKQQENDEESMKDDENGVGESNDLEEIFAMCQARNQQSFFLRLTMGLVSLLDLQVFLTNIGRCLLNLGDGITLLHLAAQYNREDWAVYLLEVCRHPVEVKTSRGETPLDQAAWRGHVTIAILLLK